MEQLYWSRSNKMAPARTKSTFCSHNFVAIQLPFTMCRGNNSKIHDDKMQNVILHFVVIWIAISETLKLDFSLYFVAKFHEDCINVGFKLIY